MRTILLSFLFLTCPIGNAQELNVGGFAGAGPWTWGVTAGMMGGSVEFRPGNAIFSINAEPHLLFNSQDLFLTTPLFLKFILGHRFRFCPTMGGFWRSNNNFGWSAGLNLEYAVRKNLILFLRGDFNKDYYQTKYPDHFGGTYPVTESGHTIWVSAGARVNLLNGKR